MSNSHAKINSFGGIYNLLHEIYSKNPTFSIFGHNVEPIFQYKTIKKRAVSMYRYSSIFQIEINIKGYNRW